jgi:hypothetical protein
MEIPLTPFQARRQCHSAHWPTLSTPSQRRQCGDLTLQTLVTPESENSCPSAQRPATAFPTSPSSTHDRQADSERWVPHSREICRAGVACCPFGRPLHVTIRGSPAGLSSTSTSCTSGSSGEKPRRSGAVVRLEAPLHGGRQNRRAEFSFFRRFLFCRPRLGPLSSPNDVLSIRDRGDIV